MPKKILFFSFVYLFSQTVIFSLPAEPDPVDFKIISHTFNEEFDLARQLCLDNIKITPNVPKYYYYLINVKVIEYYQKVRELKPENRAEGRKALNKEIIDYCEGMVDKFDIAKLDMNNKFYLGMIYGYMARLYGVDGSWWSAFKSGKKTRNIMEEIIKYDSGFYDAYLALGMLNYYADRMSGVTAFIAGVLGFSGDRDKGLNYLQLAYQKGKLTYGQTALTLIEVYTSLEGNDYAALPYYDSFLKMYPRSRRTLNSYFNTLTNIWDYKKIESLIKNDKLNLIDDLNKARFYEMKGEKEQAVKYAEKALQNESTINRGGNSARYLITLNSWLAGDNVRVNKYEASLTEESKNNFNLIKGNEKAGRWLHDFSVKLALEKPASEIEVHLKAKPDFYNQKVFDNQFKMLAGVFYFRSNQYDRSESYLYSLLDSGSEREKINAAKYLIEINMRQYRDKKKVEKLIDIIDDLDSEQLNFRCKDLEKKYNL